MAPEIHMMGLYNGFKADIFALGMLLFIMRSGTFPFGIAKLNNTLFKLLNSGKSSAFWRQHSRNKPKDFYTDDFKDLIERLFKYPDSKRISL